MGMPGRVRNYLTKADKEDIRESINRNGTPPAVVAKRYDISEFTARKIAGLVRE